MKIYVVMVNSYEEVSDSTYTNVEKAFVSKYSAEEYIKGALEGENDIIWYECKELELET